MSPCLVHYDEIDKTKPLSPANVVGHSVPLATYRKKLQGVLDIGLRADMLREAKVCTQIDGRRESSTNRISTSKRERVYT